MSSTFLIQAMFALKTDVMSSHPIILTTWSTNGRHLNCLIVTHNRIRGPVLTSYG